MIIIDKKRSKNPKGEVVFQGLPVYTSDDIVFTHVIATTSNKGLNELGKGTRVHLTYYHWHITVMYFTEEI